MAQRKPLVWIGGRRRQLPNGDTLAGAEPPIEAGDAQQYYRGDKTWSSLASAVRSVVLTGLSTATNAAITAADTIIQALGKLQAQLDAKAPKNNPEFSGIVRMPNNARIVGNNVGNTNIAALQFFDSDDVTRRGFIGDAASGNSDIYVGSDTGRVVLWVQGTIRLAADTTGIVVAGGGSFAAAPTWPTPSQGDNSQKGATTEYVDAAVAAGGGGTGFFDVVTIAATSNGQTSFTVSGGYTPGAVMVVLAGSVLAPSNYTATSGTAIVLASGVGIVVGTELQVIRMTAFSVAGALPLAGTAANSTKLGGVTPSSLILALLDDASQAAALATLGAAPAGEGLKAVQCPDIPLTANTNFSVTHNLGVQPLFLACSYRCVTAEHGYAVGDVLRPAEMKYDSNTSTATLRGPLIYTLDSTICAGRMPGTGPVITNKSTGSAVSMTPANWRLQVFLGGV